MKKSVSGLSLIETMILLAILGILVALALTQYQHYAVRVKVSEMVRTAGPCQQEIEKIVSGATQADVSERLVQACETQASKYVAHMSADANGVITVVVNSATLLGSPTSASASTLLLTPLLMDNTPVVGKSDGGKSIAQWQCGPAPTKGMDLQDLPSHCTAPSVGKL